MPHIIHAIMAQNEYAFVQKSNDLWDLVLRNEPSIKEGTNWVLDGSGNVGFALFLLVFLICIFFSLIDKEGILKLVQLLLNKYVPPSGGMKMEKQSCEVVDNLLNLLLHLLDVPVIASDLVQISSLYAPVFELRTPRWFYFHRNASNKCNDCFLMFVPNMLSFTHSCAAFLISSRSSLQRVLKFCKLSKAI